VVHFYQYLLDLFFFEILLSSTINTRKVGLPPLSLLRWQPPHSAHSSCNNKFTHSDPIKCLIPHAINVSYVLEEYLCVQWIHDPAVSLDHYIHNPSWLQFHWNDPKLPILGTRLLLAIQLLFGAWGCVRTIPTGLPGLNKRLWLSSNS